MAGRSVALIGAGRMGLALVSGWLRGKGGLDLGVVEPSPSEALKALLAEKGAALNPDPSPVDTVVIALKPQVFSGAAEAIAPWIGPGTLVLSIMAGVRIRDLETAFGADRVLRAMPNTPGAIGRGVSVLAARGGAAQKDIAAAKRLLAPLGVVEGPVDEALMPAVTALSGSGPAYVFLLAEAMAEAGRSEGLPGELAERLAQLTVAGAAALMEEGGDAPGDLRAAVTSKGGTTQAALDVLIDEGGMPSLVRKAMRAAAARERALSSNPD